MTERVRVYFKSARVCSRLATPPRHALYYCRKRFFFFYAHFLSGISLGCVFFFASIFFLPRIFLYFFFFCHARLPLFSNYTRKYIYIYSYTCARRGHREVQHTHVKRIQNTVGKTVRRYDVVFLRHTRLLCTCIYVPPLGSVGVKRASNIRKTSSRPPHMFLRKMCTR